MVRGFSPGRGLTPALPAADESRLHGVSAEPLRGGAIPSEEGGGGGGGGAAVAWTLSAAGVAMMSFGIRIKHGTQKIQTLQTASREPS